MANPVYGWELPEPIKTETEDLIAIIEIMDKEGETQFANVHYELTTHTLGYNVSRRIFVNRIALSCDLANVDIKETEITIDWELNEEYDGADVSFSFDAFKQI